jgi:hypothetical protein
MFSNQLEIKKRLKKNDDAKNFFYFAHKKTRIKKLVSHIYWL